MTVEIQTQGVSNKHDDFLRMEPWLDLVEDLRQGTARIRNQHDKYLPEFSREDPKNYERRWSQATLYPAFEETIGMLTGKAFTKAPELDEDVPKQIVGTDKEAGLIEDVDMQGNHFQVFAENFFKKGLRSGLCHLLVDSTPFPVGTSTAAEKQKAGHRPYWVIIGAEQVFNWQYKVEGGRQVLTQVRISETVEERKNEFETEKVEQIRVLEPGRFRIFRKVDTGGWTEIPEGQEGGGGPMNGYDGKPLTYIPLVTFYSDEDNGFMTAIPQMLDLAYQNIRHLQKQSDYDNCMSIACFPIFCATGLPEDEQGSINLGPFTICRSSNPETKFFYAEHSGAALSAARQDLQDLKEDMAIHGLKMLMPKPGQTPTATAEAITEASTTSQLQVAVLRLKDCLEQALEYTARWLGLGEGMGGSVNVDLKNVMLTGADVEQILKAAGAPQKQVIDVETAIEELKRRGFLDENVDAKDIMERLKDQALQSPSIAGAVGALAMPPKPAPTKVGIPPGA